MAAMCAAYEEFKTKRDNSKFPHVTGVSQGPGWNSILNCFLDLTGAILPPLKSAAELHQMFTVFEALFVLCGPLHSFMEITYCNSRSTNFVFW